MATKDLNLSLDRGLLQPKVAHSQKSKTDNAKLGAPSPGTRQANKKVARRPAQQTSRSWHGIATTGMAITNMLFLVLAGLWLSGHTDRPPQLAVSQVDVAPQLQVMQNRIDQKISSLEQQLENLQTTIDAQQQLIVLAYQDIGELLPGETTQPAPSAKAAASEATSNKLVPAVTQANEEKDWHVDLGEFSEKDAAVKVQSQLQALGYQARIQSLNTDNIMTHKIILPNFEDRKSAELAAARLMEKTELNSLSVSKGT